MTVRFLHDWARSKLAVPNGTVLSAEIVEAAPQASGPTGTVAIWIAEVPRIRASDGLARELLEAHERMIESRSDLSECQKNARRRVVLEAWYAEQATAEKAEQ